jgi:hypothetical protein
MSITTNLSQPPYQIPLTDPKTGMMTPQWQQWIASAFVRMGGGQAVPNNLASNASTVSGLQATVTAQSSAISTLQTQVTGLLVGRNL